MGSWWKCPCGNNVHKNLFAGASVRLIISDKDLNDVDDSWSTQKILAHILRNGRTMVRCKNCSRMLIEAREEDRNFRVYLEETDE